MNFTPFDYNATPISPATCQSLGDRETQWDRILSRALDDAIRAKYEAAEARAQRKWARS